MLLYAFTCIPNFGGYNIATTVAWTPDPVKHTQYANVKRDSAQSESDKGRFPPKIGYPSKFGYPTDLTPGGLWEKDFQYRARRQKSPIHTEKSNESKSYSRRLKN